MTVTVLLITHEEIGTALLQAAEQTLGDLPLETTVISVKDDTNPEALLPRLQQFIQQTDMGKGLLILTDLYGSTPSNIAKNLQNDTNIRVISGLNLPMLIKIMNYAHLPLNELAEKAISGGKQGVVNCTNKK